MNFRGPICQLLEEGRTRENRQNSKFPQSFVWEFELCASGGQNSRESGGEMTGRNGDAKLHQTFRSRSIFGVDLLDLDLFLG